MSVEVWYGSKPRHAAEQKTLLELYQYLHPQQEHFVLLHNFFAGQGNEIDLVVLKRDGIFLSELKHVWDRIVGGREIDGEILVHPLRVVSVVHVHTVQHAVSVVDGDVEE